MTTGASTHASAVRVGERAVLIRGPSGSGKSRLAFALIMAGRAGVVAATELIGDDRVMLEAEAGRLIARPAPELAGLIEVRGLGIRRCPFAAAGEVVVVVDLAAADAARLPDREAAHADVQGVVLPRIAVAPGWDALPLVAAFLTTDDAVGS
jgi:serine kinase of HPr protein (carbohydrate metabolism regulator)